MAKVYRGQLPVEPVTGRRGQRLPDALPEAGAAEGDGRRSVAPFKSLRRAEQTR